MIKYLRIIIVLFVLSANYSFAQTYSLFPNDSIMMDGMLEDIQELTIEQHNTTSGIINLKWKKISASVPPAWDAWVCDNKICFATLVDSGSMLPVGPGDYGFLLIHITPHVNYGTAIIQYAVWCVTDPNHIDTLTYIFTSNANSAVGEIDNAEFYIFPNPVKEKINIISNYSSGFNFFISDIFGKEIANGNSESGSLSYLTDKLKEGIYSVSIVNRNAIVLSKKFVVIK
jgi:hypothetical protein